MVEALVTSGKLAADRSPQLILPTRFRAAACPQASWRRPPDSKHEFQAIIEQQRLSSGANRRRRGGGKTGDQRLQRYSQRDVAIDRIDSESREEIPIRRTPGRISE